MTQKMKKDFVPSWKDRCRVLMFLFLHLIKLSLLIMVFGLHVFFWGGVGVVEVEKVCFSRPIGYIAYVNTDTRVAQVGCILNFFS